MTRTLTLLALVAAAALAGCDNSDHTIIAGPPGDDANTTANADVTLPPSIAASKVYRCADNDVVYVDWLSDGTANLRTEKDSARVKLAAAEPGKPLTAEGGYSLAGTSADARVRIAVPGQSEESCRA